MILKTPNGEVVVCWQMIAVIIATSFGIYLGGVTSGYLISRSEYAHRAQQRDVTVAEMAKKLDQLPQNTATEVKKYEDGKPKQKQAVASQPVKEDKKDEPDNSHP